MQKHVAGRIPGASYPCSAKTTGRLLFSYHQTETAFQRKPELGCRALTLQVTEGMASSRRPNQEIYSSPFGQVEEEVHSAFGLLRDKDGSQKSGPLHSSYALQRTAVRGGAWSHVSVSRLFCTTSRHCWGAEVRDSREAEGEGSGLCFLFSGSTKSAVPFLNRAAECNV
ncbi:uncharacterized protein LOC113964088 isoform X2 [Neopelma chrysocephalum]|uniref:uncharacterized protein LOC113964088 isoform X2 n=1 Tax=Neopelma chrysocephalum TaxID=114329 RepID=UPI000FCD4B40|nr:uncharacterized protein LOC113964088 isoform X2 [Neopelma chrysocephalum]